MYQDSAPYQLLVDHLASASDSKQTFANVSTIECPSKPSDYTCPQLLNVSKDDLAKKICEYDTVLTGIISLIPDTDKAQTRCGAMKIDKPLVKSDDDATELTDKMAVVLGKDCQLKSISDKEANKEEQIHMLVKASLPSSTKFILADGANMDLLSGSLIKRDEIASILKQCPKVAATTTATTTAAAAAAASGAGAAAAAAASD